jgi:DNA-binding transcriptional regulator YiaG
MAERDNKMRKFGPMLIEAIVIITMDEINILRSQLGLSPRTFEQLLTVIDSKLDDLPPYDWMTLEF